MLQCSVISSITCIIIPIADFIQSVFHAASAEKRVLINAVCVQCSACDRSTFAASLQICNDNISINIIVTLTFVITMIRVMYSVYACYASGKCQYQSLQFLVWLFYCIFTGVYFSSTVFYSFVQLLYCISEIILYILSCLHSGLLCFCSTVFRYLSIAIALYFFNTVSFELLCIAVLLCFQREARCNGGSL